MTLAVWSQDKVVTKFVSKTPFEDRTIVRIDNFGTIYSFEGNTFYSVGDRGQLDYSNVQLGSISSANAFNPLKINLFYKDFNTLMVLDNRLAEIKKIDFNALEPFRMITHLTAANDNRVWVFNDNTQQLELYDYLNDVTILNTFPIEGALIDLKSNYNYCWVLTDMHLYTFNYFGSLISKTTNTDFTELQEASKQLVLKKGNQLFATPKSHLELKEVMLPKLLIKQFFVLNETLYIYDGESIHQFQLIND
jgi:hypothetical protein